MTKIISPIPAIAKKAAVPADMLSREEIAFLRDLPIASTCPVMQRALDAAEAYLDEPARLASARQEGYRAGIADAKQAAGFAAWRHDGDDAHSRGMDAGARHQVAECVKAIVALSPLPAEPSAPVAPDWPTRCAALEADGIAARKRVAALEAENAKLRERNEKLVEGLMFYANPETYTVNDPPFSGLKDDLSADHGNPLLPQQLPGRRARALLQGQGGAS